VATDAQAAWWGERGLGTIPHALIATFGGDTVAAVAAFARQFPGVPLIALVDFDNDSVATSLACAKEFGERLWGVRLDTSGTMVDRSLWSEMGEFAPTGVPVDSYAVGSSLLKGSADYTADVVLREGRPCAKVGRVHRPSARLQPVDLTAHRGTETPV